MTKRNLIITAVILVFAAYSSQYFKNTKSTKQDALIGKALINAALFESVDSIKLVDAANSVTLTKMEESWVVKNEGDFPVNMEKLIGLMEQLSTFQVASVITKDSKKLADFEVLFQSEGGNDKKGAGSEVILKSGDKELSKIVFGKKRTSVVKSNRGANSAGTYVRVGDKKVVYIIKDDFTLDADAKEWIRTSLFKVEKDQVNKIEFKTYEANFSLVKEGKSKKFEMPEIEKEQKLQDEPESGLLNDLSDFSISDTQLRTSEFEKVLTPKAEIVVSLADDSQIQFNILEFTKMEGDKKEQEYFINFVKSQKDYDASITQLSQKWLFKIDEWKIKKWFKAKAEYYQAAKK